MRTEIVNGGDFLTNSKTGHLRADLDDLAAGLVANHVRVGEQRAVPTVERVATLDAYRFDADHNTFRMAYRIGNVLVLENFWTPVLIIDCCLHRGSPSISSLSVTNTTRLAGQVNLGLG